MTEQFLDLTASVKSENRAKKLTLEGAAFRSKVLIQAIPDVSMDSSGPSRQLLLGHVRKQILTRLHQPSTTLQLARRFGVKSSSCMRNMQRLRSASLLTCLNSSANKSRLYWLTMLGLQYQHDLRHELGLREVINEFPKVDWELYGWVCFSHRSAILKALNEPLQPSAIKRKARSQNPALRMSANNVRAVIRLFRLKGIVEPISVGKGPYPSYQLTETGNQLRELLIRAEVNS